MKEIKLTKGFVTQVDDDDFEILKDYRWYTLLSGRNRMPYAATNIKLDNGRLYPLKMQRFLLGLSRGDKRQGDHKNRNTLDNRRENLRIASNRQNSLNRRGEINVTSKYKGVHWNTKHRKWEAGITIHRKYKYLGLHTDEAYAAAAYNYYAKRYFGEFAYLNVTSIPELLDEPRTKKVKKASKFRGVRWHQAMKKWMAAVTYKGKLYKYSYHSNEDAAALAYNELALEQYGKKAKFNEVQSSFPNRMKN